MVVKVCVVMLTYGGVMKLEDILKFGKHKGKTIKELVDSDYKGYNYIAWCVANIDWFKLDEEAVAYVYKKGEQYKISCSVRMGETGTPHGRRQFERMLSGGPSGEYAQDAYDSSFDFEESMVEGDDNYY